ncbi:hypothetical protein SUGI_1225210 [Cryptomeria japonica]|uniref:Uncharacterized protein n=1 Tax=Cryptomeria japonica TaxID=3369 RepID=A0AAD3NMV9_CRYJA|nr:hypothetical protein SUGI_1225210 [Cryptomeria japonica]
MLGSSRLALLRVERPFSKRAPSPEAQETLKSSQRGSSHLRPFILITFSNLTEPPSASKKMLIIHRLRLTFNCIQIMVGAETSSNGSNSRVALHSHDASR